MAAHRKSIIREVLDRLDDLMALGQSRGKAKEEARAAGQKTWAFTTGKIHSYKTRSTYQEHCIRFAYWARDTYAIKHLDELDAYADELSTEFLQQYLDAGKSPYTLQTIRSALRLFFADRTLAGAVQIPRRSLENITRSRGPEKQDTHFQPANWQHLINFLRATGLRKDEVEFLKVGDIHEYDPLVGGPAVFVANGKGGKSRTVAVLAGQEQAVLALKVGRRDDELVFPQVPQRVGAHRRRREFAQSLYLSQAPDHQTLPPPTKRLQPKDYDRDAAGQVSKSLGHNRLDVTRQHYLR